MSKSDTQFKQGNPGGPGRPKLTEIEREVREATRENLAEAWGKIQEMSLAQLRKVVKDGKRKGYFVGMASAYLKWVETGDFVKIDKILDRILGKSVQTTEISGSLGLHGDKQRPLHHRIADMTRTVAEASRANSVDGK